MVDKSGLCAAHCNNVFDYGHRAAADQMRTSWEKQVQFVGTSIGGADVTVKKFPQQSRLFHSKRCDFIKKPIDLDLIKTFDLNLLICK
jgi:hypothetical protein